MKKVLLDTNAYSKLFTGDEKVLAALSKANTVYMSIFVLAELYTGFRGGRKETDNREILDKFIEKPTVKILDASQDTAEAFAHIKNNLKLAGTPIPINDVWIAAHVMETGSVLVTYDQHFLQIKGLHIWNVLTG